MATLEQPPVAASPEEAVITNGRWAGYARLLQMRMLELWREPEVIFWVFVFPILLALGLGIAFRNKPADVCRVALVQGPEAARVMDSIRSSPAAHTRTVMIRCCWLELGACAGATALRSMGSGESVGTRPEGAAIICGVVACGAVACGARLIRLGAASPLTIMGPSRTGTRS